MQLQYQHAFHLADGASLTPRLVDPLRNGQLAVACSTWAKATARRRTRAATSACATSRGPSAAWWVDAFVRNVGDNKVKTSAMNGFGAWVAQYLPPRTVGINTGIDF